MLPSFKLGFKTSRVPKAKAKSKLNLKKFKKYFEVFLKK